MRRQRQETMLPPADLFWMGGMFSRGFDTKEIASIMQVTEATVYNHLSLARAIWARHRNAKPEESVL